MKSQQAQAAALIRKELKKNGIKARVTSASGSMTSSVNVDIQQDVLPAAVKEITAFAEQFEYGHFDGMTDCYEYSNRRDDLPQVKFVFVTVSYSDEIKAEVRNFLQLDGGDFETAQQVHRVLSGRNAPEFWNSRKPVVRINNLIDNTPAMLKRQAD